ncbi:hypothetical protein [Mesorhizobium sp.]|uniref:hypothetical protein n=1 Tax=Mesorhizobium sp. TaxID=1871066 RepID=UPI002580E8C9|nr:hypothetical protein [Mesorhizobium sp.]
MLQHIRARGLGKVDQGKPSHGRVCIVQTLADFVDVAKILEGIECRHVSATDRGC